MENSKKVLEQAKIYPKLRLAIKKPGGGIEPTGPHTVKLVEDRIVKGIDRDTGEEIFLMRYTLEEDGELRRYDTKLKDKAGDPSYLIQRMAEFEPGDVVVMEMKKAGKQNYAEVTPVGEGSDDEPVEGHEEDVDRQFEELRSDQP